MFFRGVRQFFSSHYFNKSLPLRTRNQLKMKSIASILISLLLVFSTVNAFSTPSLNTRVALLPKQSSVPGSSTSLNVFGAKKSKAAKEEEARKAAMYWEGDWVCKDCGYIYQRVRIVMHGKVALI